MEKSSFLIYIHGQVQGVGFRHFTYKNATSLDLAGYVKNLPDGRVEVAAEGSKENLEELLSRLKQGPAAARVEDIRVEWKSHQNRFNSFSIETSF